MKILLLSTYPIDIPLHGGQIRVRNIFNAYKEAGYEVSISGVLGSDNYPASEGFIRFPGYEALSSVYAHPFLMEDYAIGELLLRDKYYEQLKGKISFKPDLIQVEHPWLFGFAQRLVKDLNIKSKIIYSSHNVECILKRDILSKYISGARLEDIFLRIKALELAVIREADAFITVSTNDSEWIKVIASKPILMAPNGVEDRSMLSPNNASALALIKAKEAQSFALYCASAHPPNIEGFFEMFGGGFGSLSPDQSLILAGSASYSIAQDERVHRSAKLAERVVVGGTVTDECLATLLNLANCIILPIMSGGGTNLKTAEALFSKKYVVSTSLAMRGFEEFIGTHGVAIADDPASFKRAIRECMNSPPLQLSHEEIRQREKLTWDSCLSGVSNFAYATRDCA